MNHKSATFEPPPSPPTMQSDQQPTNTSPSSNNTTTLKDETNLEKPHPGQIIKNESFFSEHLRNPSLNPLLLTSLNRLNKLEESLDKMTNEDAKITVSDAALFAANFKQKPIETRNGQFTLPPLTSSTTDSSVTTMCRDGFVTNQRYQNLKDSKHSAGVLSTCYDEVFQVVGDDDEEDNDSDNSQGDSKNEKCRLQDSVVIDMYNESDEDV